LYNKLYFSLHISFNFPLKQQSGSPLYFVVIMPTTNGNFDHRLVGRLFLRLRTQIKTSYFHLFILVNNYFIGHFFFLTNLSLFLSN